MSVAAEQNSKSTVHHGFNVKVVRIRRKQWKQSVLAEQLDMTQEQMSRLENQEVIDDAMLNKLAKTLDCSFDFLKSEDIEKLIGEYSESGSVINNDNVTMTTGENAQVEEFIQQKSETIKEQTNIYKDSEGIVAAYEKLNVAFKEIGGLEVTVSTLKSENGRLLAELEAYKNKQ